MKVVSGGRSFQGSADDRSVIRVQGGSLPRNVADAEQLLAAATRKDPSLGVFQRGGILVRTTRLPVATSTDGIRRAAGTLQILPIGPDLLRLKLTECATWERFDRKSKDWVQTDASASVARTLEEAAGLWTNTPALHGIIEAPALRPDGTILDTPGYDEGSGLYLDPGIAELRAVPLQPTQEDARFALDRLFSIVDKFPFLDIPSLSVAVALLITPLVRHALRAAPLFVISAPKMGSGKTLLAHLPAYIATGRPPALISQSETPDEERKRLLAILLEGSAVTVIDNIERPLKSDVLCTALTEPVIRDRILGSTRTISAPTTTTWVATGNNVRIDGDLSSRTLLCTLDPRCERPEERDFAINLHNYVPGHRGELAAAALTVVRAYIAAGCPAVNAPTFGRYEDWCKYVRNPLVWLGMADPCETRKAIEARDPVRDNLGNLLESWWSVFGDGSETAASVIESISDIPPAGMTEDLHSLRSAVLAVAEERGRIDGRRFGNFLSKHERRIERGLRFERNGTRQHALIWRVKREA